MAVMTQTSFRSWSFALLGLFCLIATRAPAQDALLFVPPEDQPFDGFAAFGQATAVSGRTAMVSAPFVAPPDPTAQGNFPYVGVVNIYTADVNHTAWTLTRVLHAEDGDRPDWYFGSGLAAEGKRLIVSAALTFRVYEKRARGYVLLDKVSLPSQPQGPLVYKDGVLAFKVSTNQGWQVLVYKINARGKAEQVATLVAPSSNPAGFTGGLAYDPNSGLLAIGFSGVSDSAPGQVYSYARRQGRWVLLDTLAAPESTALEFGAALALWRDKLVVGAPQADFNYEPSFNFVDNSGAAYIYQRKGSHWHLTQKLATNDPSSPVANLVAFGTGIAANGRYVWIQAPATGDQHFTTVQAGPSTLFQWEGDRLTLFHPRLGDTTPGGLAMSRHYVVEGSGDPIFGETAAIVDLTLLEGSNSATTEDGPEEED
jgi:hypothetical protein